MANTRRKIHKHTAWGITYNGVYDSSLRLGYSEEEAWAIAAFKHNMMTKKEFDERRLCCSAVKSQIKAKLKTRNIGVCRVRVTQQQTD